ncbi:TolC family protein [Gramella sp. KN1008]|uniref:TolC family protein n=1 Tax=Gramella sp. KN1008 TaxID=2529298 RepID=UPI00103ABB39|nr:TolC family protein [Gramella sp. KN1008]TBW28081.1 TolC family protein [Gramella sp. KN1008]
MKTGKRLNIRSARYKRNRKKLPLWIAFSFSLFTFHSISAQQLESYINEAQNNNPELRAYNSRVDIAREKVEEVNSLPDTELSAGIFVSEPETRTGPQTARFSVRQMLPWFGTIDAREKAAGAMVNVEDIEADIARRKIALAVSQNYYQLYALQEKQEVLQENIDLLELYHQLALNSVEAGNASAIEVLRLKMRQNELKEQQEILGFKYNSKKVEFNKVLNREVTLQVALPDTLAIDAADTIAVSGNIEVNPEILKFDGLSESILQAEALNQKEALPKLGLGLDYVNVAKRTDMEMSDNGKDILMPMVSVSIPIFSNKYRSVTRQNEIRQQEVAQKREDKLNQLQSRLEAAMNARSSAIVSWKVQLDNLEQARNAEEILIKTYETGRLDFDDVLDIQELQLKIQMNLIDAVVEYYQETAMIEYFLGTDK